MVPDPTNTCWKALLLLTRTLETYTGPVEFCSIHIGKTPTVKINSMLPSSRNAHAVWVSLDSKPEIESEGGSLFTVRNLIDVTLLRGNGLPREALELMIAYLPYCFLPVYARRWNRAVSVSHFAQSLDGRIATGTGDSRWIGDEYNQTHAHRMRALCQAILIGSKTLKRDKPQLTVRRVEGPNPRPVLLGSSVGDMKEFTRFRGFSALTLAPENGPLSPMKVLEFLYGERLSSVYIEGGSVTTSHFLEDDAIDIVQIHISPMILGSGISSFSLPPVETIDEARRFGVVRYQPVGDGIMFVGVPASRGRIPGHD